MAQLVEYDKKFVIIGNQNAITYKEIFSLIKDNKIWLGHSLDGRNIWFRVPDSYEKYHKIENGEKYAFVASTVWFTNLDHKKRQEEMILYKTYNKEEYPQYDNYDAININKTKDIPIDYKGYMGVPITFLHKYNPDQFEIIALGIVGSIDFANNRKMEILDKTGKPTGKFTFNAKGTLYRKYNPKTDKKAPAFKDFENGELYSSIYARVIIKNKKI